MTTKLVFVSGKKRAGKDTIANYLVDKFNFTRVAFADALKDEVSQIYKIDRVSMDDDKIKCDPQPLPGMLLSLRQLLQMHGVSRRNDCELYWKNRADEKINQILENGGKVVVSDVRFENELQIEKLKVTPDEVLTLRVNRKALISDDQHITETALDHFQGFDEIIDNEENCVQLMFAKIEKLLK